MATRTTQRITAWVTEVSYWLIALIGLTLASSQAERLAESWWPGHRAALSVLGEILFLVVLAALIIRRQRVNGQPPYSTVRALGLALAALVVPMVVLIGGAAALLYLLHS